MIDKIKSYAVDVLSAIALILTAVLYVVFGQKRQLKDKLSSVQGEKELGDIVAKKEAAQKESDSAEDDYKRTRDEFIKRSGDGADGGKT